jgi:hypothetical protein
LFLPRTVARYITGIPVRKWNLDEDSVEARVPADDVADTALARNPEELADHRVPQIEVDEYDV